MLAFYLAALDTDLEQVKMTEIYHEHRHVMLRYARKIVKNDAMAEDAVHNVMLAIMKHKEKYFPLESKNLRNKLIVMTKNKCIDLLRQQTAFTDEPIDEIEYLLVSKELPIEDQIIQNDQYETLRKHISSLDDASKSVLEMKYLLGMTYKEIGDELDITPKHVETKIMRAKEKVRKLMAKGGGSVE